MLDPKVGESLATRGVQANACFGVRSFECSVAGRSNIENEVCLNDMATESELLHIYCEFVDRKAVETL